MAGGGSHGFVAVADYVEDNLGFATSHYNDSYLKRRIRSRMRRTGADDYAAYLHQLREEDGEGDALLSALSINVTGFFRNPGVWDGVRGALRELAAARDSVRVWCAACADGREAYSIAMLATDDPEIDEARVSVTGTDINERAIASAREGVYESTHTADLDEQLRYLRHYPSYVDRTGERFRVAGPVREHVRFHVHDIIRDPAPWRFELVMCRNLFIYIDAEHKGPVVDTIVDCLVPRGYLVIGKAETIPGESRAAFDAVDNKKRIYRRR